MKKILLLMAAIMLCASCGGRHRSGGVDDAGSRAPKTYKIPEIPSVVSDPGKQAEYLSEHFWDNFDFRDTVNIGNADYTEQAFANYLQVLANIPRNIGDSSVKTMFRKAAVDKDMFRHFAELSETYLYDPNSPFRDDEYYITVLEAVLADPGLDEWERIRPQEQLRMSLKNRVGEPAADFRYTLASGASGSLYGIKAQYTLLFINNPGCAACKETQMEVSGSPVITEMISEGRLAVLAVYPDEDLEAWRDYAPNMPPEWINSYDRNLVIKNEELYDLKAIPTLYLLDKDKKVILKDETSVQKIAGTLYYQQ